MTEPAAVLFACNLNSIRSPMAAALLRKRRGSDVHAESCGVWSGGELDPFMVEVMRDAGVDASAHTPQTFEDLTDSNFDLIVALTPQSLERAQAYARGIATDVEYFEVFDPTRIEGSRNLRLDAYRRARDDLDAWIRSRFCCVSTKPAG